MADTAEMWAQVALMGHVELWGRLSEEEKFGVKMGRVDVPKGDGEDEYTTVYFGGAAVYRITPTDEETAREMAGYRPRRIGPYVPIKPTFGQAPLGGFDRGHYDDDEDDDDSTDAMDEEMDEPAAPEQGEVDPATLPF